MKTKLLIALTVLCLLCSCSQYNRILRPSVSPIYSEANEPKQSPIPAAVSSELKVHFIDVGQGDSILVQTPNGKSILIDAGTREEGKKVTDYIESQGISKIDAVVGTHPHEDHIGGLEQVLNKFEISSIYMPKKSTTTKTFEALLNTVKNKGLKINTAFSGVYIKIDPELTIQMFAPNNSNYEDLNDFSAVIKLTYNKTSFLLTGDAQSISEKEILSKGYDLKSDVLKVGHHGSRSSTTKEFLKAVSPEYAVISVGKLNDYGHPAKETLKKLSTDGVKVYRTDQSGTITATSDGNTIKFYPQ